MRIAQEARLTSSCLDISLPKGWLELNESQLRYYAWLSSRFSAGECKRLFLIRLMGLKRIGPQGGRFRCEIGGCAVLLDSEQLACAMATLSWLDSYNVAVRPDAMRGSAARHRLLQDDTTFYEYLMLENWWYAFLKSHDVGFLCRMAKTLYGFEASSLTGEEQFLITLWYAGFKQEIQQFFPSYFKPSGGGGEGDAGMMEITDAQIRALTGGDVTKEQSVLDIQLWRALSELNSKAREADELRKLMKR